MIIFNMLVKRTLKKEHPFFRKDLVWYSLKVLLCTFDLKLGN